MKRCTKCGETKAENEFHRDKRRTDGRHPRCRKCTSEKDRRYYEKNREARLERSRLYYEKNREARLEYQRRYSNENREAKNERSRRYRKENREANLESSRRATIESRQIAKKYAAKSGRFSPEEDREVMRYDMTALEIAIALGRTYNSVVNRRATLRKKEKTNV